MCNHLQKKKRGNNAIEKFSAPTTDNSQIFCISGIKLFASKIANLRILCIALLQISMFCAVLISSMITQCHSRLSLWVSAKGSATSKDNISAHECVT